MEVGRGHMSIESIEDALKAKNREAAGPTAPAKGLTLIGYEFL
jgi:tRNA pseudouridine38-40 synthase